MPIEMKKEMECRFDMDIPGKRMPSWHCKIRLKTQTLIA